MVARETPVAIWISAMGVPARISRATLARLCAALRLAILTCVPPHSWRTWRSIELHTQRGLQRRHPPRQPRLRDQQRPAGRGKAAALDHLGEEQHVVQILHRGIVPLTEQEVVILPSYRFIDPTID